MKGPSVDELIMASAANSNESLADFNRYVDFCIDCLDGLPEILVEERTKELDVLRADGIAYREANLDSSILWFRDFHK